MSVVYLLWHHRPDEADDDAKLLGVYGSRETAQQRIDSKYRFLPGFSVPDFGEFTIDEYEVDQDQWESGFSRMVNIMIPLRNDPSTAWRCVVSDEIALGQYEVLSASDPLDEANWEFKPGQIVTCEVRNIDGIGECLAAVAIAPSVK